MERYSHGAVSPCCDRNNKTRALRHSEAATTFAFRTRHVRELDGLVRGEPACAAVEAAVSAAICLGLRATCLPLQLKGEKT